MKNSSARQHRERAGEHAGDHRVARRQVAHQRQDHDRADDVVAGVGEPAEQPAVGGGRHGETLRRLVAELREHEDTKNST